MDSVLKTETRHQDPAGPDLGSWRLFGGAIGGVLRVGPVACSGQFPSQPPPAANGGETWAAGSLVSRTTPTSPTQLPTGQQTHCPVSHSHSPYSLLSVFLLAIGGRHCVDERCVQYTMRWSFSLLPSLSDFYSCFASSPRTQHTLDTYQRAGH